MSILKKAERAALALAFAGAATAKLRKNEMMAEDFRRFGYPPWFMNATAAAEATGAAGMLAGTILSAAPKPAGVLLAGIMVGALASHLRAKDPPRRLIPPAALLGLIAAATTD
jgi:putative oxidoreductase